MLHIDIKKRTIPVRYVVFLLKQAAFIASKNNIVDVNILGGNGENVLHVASRSDLIRSNVSIYP